MNTKTPYGSSLAVIVTLACVPSFAKRPAETFVSVTKKLSASSGTYNFKCNNQIRCHARRSLRFKQTSGREGTRNPIATQVIQVISGY